jgi:hypothetical protein
LDNISILLVTLTTQTKVTIKVLFVTALMSDEACDLASGSSHQQIANQCPHNYNVIWEKIF